MPPTPLIAFAHAGKSFNGGRVLAVNDVSLDVEQGLLKTLVFAVIIVAIGGYQGFNTRGGAAGVGRATTGAVVISIILIFAANVIMSYLMFGGG